MIVNYANDQVYFDGPNSKKSANFGCVCAQSLHFHKITETFLLLQRATKKKENLRPCCTICTWSHECTDIAVHSSSGKRSQQYPVPELFCTSFQCRTARILCHHKMGFALVALYKRSTVSESLLSLFKKERPYFSYVFTSFPFVYAIAQERIAPVDLYKRATGAIHSLSRANRSFSHKKTSDSLEKAKSEFPTLINRI